MPEDVTRRVRDGRVVIILRGHSAATCRRITDLLHGAGLRLFEVTFDSGEPVEAIAALHEAYGAEIPIGAGTVLTAEDVSRAADAGARFIVSPNVDEAVIERTKELGLTSIPGAFTPSEIVRAVRAGADIVKVFPIRPVGADYLRQLRGPLPHVPLLATGGVDVDLAGDCIAAGATGVGVGVHLLGSPDDHDGLARNARRLLEVTGA